MERIRIPLLTTSRSSPYPMLEFFAGLSPVRRIADAWLVRFAHRRTAMLDAMDVPAVQQETLLRLIQKAKDTKFGRDHGFAGITNVEQYQAAVPVRTYEDFWRDYWQATFPKLEGTTWPDFILYYALPQAPRPHNEVHPITGDARFNLRLLSQRWPSFEMLRLKLAFFAANSSIWRQHRAASRVERRRSGI